ncbi:MAG: hypothetical protein IH940_13130 [Acidobacteria bacterium]|nr:hypothetical protein [Acidobacteriota bacterium]
MRRQYHFWPGESGIDAWDVDRLIELSAGIASEEVELASIAEIDSVYWFGGDRSRATVRAVIDHVRLIAGVDRSFPVILGPNGRVMDGMHRIARALLEGDETIHAVRFTELPPPDHVDCNPVELSYER